MVSNNNTSALVACKVASTVCNLFCVSEQSVVKSVMVVVASRTSFSCCSSWAAICAEEQVKTRRDESQTQKQGD